MPKSSMSLKMCQKMPPKSAKLRQYSLSRQNSIKFGRYFTPDRIFDTNIVGTLVHFCISASIIIVICINFQPFPAVPSISSYFKPVLASSSYFRPFPVNPAIFNNSQPVLAIILRCTRPPQVSREPFSSAR